MSLLATLVEVSNRVGATSSRTAKIRELAQTLRALEPDEIEIGVRYLAGELPPYDRLLRSQKSRSSHAAGCFPGGRAVVIATIWAGEYEWVRQHVMLMDETGKLSPLRVRDYRFRAHEAIYAVDGDGDGVDDIATRGYGPNLGGTSILRITPSTTPKDPPRLERMATGFGWEYR